MLFWRMWFIISPLMAMKLDKSNPTDVMVNNTFEDLEEMADMPNPGTNSNDAEANLGIGRLAANMEFLLLKVAELETVVELQQIELNKVSGCCTASLLQTKKAREQEGARQAEIILERVLQKHHNEREASKFVTPMKSMEGMSHVPTPSPSPVPQPAAKSQEASLLERRESSSSKQFGEGLESTLQSKEGGINPLNWVNDAVNKVKEGTKALPCSVKAPSFGLGGGGGRMELRFFEAACKIQVATKTITLFEFKFNNLISVPWPEPLSTVFNAMKSVKSLVKLGEKLVDCATNRFEGDDIRTSANGIVTCLGNSIIDHVPPFSHLKNLNFLEGFAKVAGTVAGQVLKRGSSLIQEAALSKFPAVGASPVVHHSGRSLVIKTHSRKHKLKMSALQVQGDDDPPNDGISFNLHDEGSNYQSKLVTQFHGYEKDTSSCLAFAPKSKHGADGQATEADWQVQNEDAFVALEPWAVPCGNDWMKRNWNKWQGYSFYTGESAIERCMTVTYGINVQPVVAFVGGVQFDVMPEPLASVDTTVCWPEGRPDGQDLSLLRTEIKSSGVLLFGRSLRLSKRFGTPTHFAGPHTHASTGTWKGSTNPQQAISRTKLLQTSQNEARQASNESGAAQNARGEEAAQEDQGLLEWMEEEDLYLASANYSDLGVNLTSELRGAAAERQLSLTATRARGAFELFNFNFAKSGMVNFQLKALLDGTSLEMRTQLGFADRFKSEEKKLKMVDIVDQFAVVLHALPFVAPLSRDKALNALKDFATKDVPAPPPPVVLRPGSSIFIKNRASNRYLNIGPHTHVTSSNHNHGDRERWTVVDAGSGEVALYNEQTGRFLTINEQSLWGHPTAPSHWHRSWRNTRFTVVTSVGGWFGLHNKLFNVFVSVNQHGHPYVSGKVNAESLLDWWIDQHFHFEVAEPYLKPGSRVALYSKHHHSWLRMHDTYLDRPYHHGVTPLNFNAAYTWEIFEVVEQRSGEIALWSPKWERFVAVGNDGKSYVSTSRIQAYELPDEWTWERFVVVPLGDGQIALHNPAFNRFLRANEHGIDASGHCSPAEFVDQHWWAWERWQVVELPGGSNSVPASPTLPGGWTFDAAG